VATVLCVAIPVAMFVLMVYALHTWLVREADPFHLSLLAGAAAVLVDAAWLAAAGVPMAWCLLVVTLAPAVTVVGYEAVGHRHLAAILNRSLSRDLADRWHRFVKTHEQAWRYLLGLSVTLAILGHSLGVASGRFSLSEEVWLETARHPSIDRLHLPEPARRDRSVIPAEFLCGWARALLARPFEGHDRSARPIDTGRTPAPGPPINRRARAGGPSTASAGFGDIDSKSGEGSRPTRRRRSDPLSGHSSCTKEPPTVASWRSDRADSSGCPVGGRDRIFSSQDPYQPPVGGGYRGGREVVVDHEVGHLLDRHVRAERAGRGAHDLLDRLVASPLELGFAKQAQDHPFIVHDHAGVPPHRADPLTNLSDRLVQPARRHISSGHAAGPPTLGAGTLDGKPGGQPIELPVHVVVDLGEPQALEPPRGSWA
jgi:hypothetical protein